MVTGWRVLKCRCGFEWQEPARFPLADDAACRRCGRAAVAVTEVVAVGKLPTNLKEAIEKGGRTLPAIMQEVFVGQELPTKMQEALEEVSK